MGNYSRNWKYDINPSVLSRGEAYFIQGRVGNIRQEGSGYAATVYGSFNYDVYVELEDGHLVAADCNCPYAENGEYCKHVAALLFALTSKKEKITDEELLVLDKIIKDMPKDDLAHLLLKLASTTPWLKDYLLKMK